MKSEEFVPLRDLPDLRDLRAGDLLLLQMETGSPTPLYVTNLDLGCGCWLFDGDDRRRVQDGDGGWLVLRQSEKVRLLCQLRGVKHADLADDRWPETERRLRAAAVEQPSTPTAPKIGDTLTAEQIAALPVGAVVQQAPGADLEYVAQRTPVGWRNVALHACFEPDNEMGRVGQLVNLKAGIRLLALGCDAPDRVGLTRQLAAAGHTPAQEWLREHAAHPLVRAQMEPPAPPLPKINDHITTKDFDRLPVGAVVDTHDGSGMPWTIKRAEGWEWIGGHALGEMGWVQSVACDRQGTLVGLDAPSSPAELRAWCVDRGYPRAIVAERKLTNNDVRKQIIDAEHATEQTQPMTLPQQITTDRGTFLQKTHESAQEFLERVASGTPDQTKLTAVAEATKPRGALDHITGTLAQVGRDFATDGVKAVLDSKALVLVDAGRLALHKAIVVGAEAAGGDKAAVTALRVAQHPATAVVEDVLLVGLAALTGRQGLAASVRGRLVRRAVDGAEEAVVAKGASFVTQLSQAFGMLSAASAAAELPAETAQAEKVEG